MVSMKVWFKKNKNKVLYIYFPILSILLFGVFLSSTDKHTLTQEELFFKNCKSDDIMVMFMEESLKNSRIEKDEDYRRVLDKCIKIHNTPIKKDSWQKQLGIGV